MPPPAPLVPSSSKSISDSDTLSAIVAHTTGTAETSPGSKWYHLQCMPIITTLSSEMLAGNWLPLLMILCGCCMSLGIERSVQHGMAVQEAWHALQETRGAVDSPKIRLSGSVSVCIPFLISLIDHNSKLQLPLMGKRWRCCGSLEDIRSQHWKGNCFSLYAIRFSR